MTAANREIIAALNRLAALEPWRQMLAENVGPFGAGFEPFVQRSLLWAFNTDHESKYIAACEKFNVDLVIFERRKIVDWWNAWRAQNTRMYLTLCDALLEIKMAHTQAPHWPLAREAAKGVENDIAKLRSKGGNELHVLLCLTGVYPLGNTYNDISGCRADDEGVNQIDACEQTFWKYVTSIDRKRCRVGDVWLVRNESIASDVRRNAFVRAILLDVSARGEPATHDWSRPQA